MKRGTVSSWRVGTDRGELHVKVWAEAEWEWHLSALRGAAEVEAAAYGLGVEMAAPVAINQRVGRDVVTVHRWVEGRTLAGSDDVASWVGRTLAALHTIPRPTLSPEDSLTAFYGTHSSDEWARWIDEGAEKRLPWVDAARGALPAVMASTEIAQEGLSAGLAVVGTHRDLHADNVLVDGGQLALVDWDYAGPDVAWFETVRAAVEFGRVAASVDGAKADLPDDGVVRAVIREYLRSGGEEGPRGAIALAGVFAMALSRLAWQVWVSLGDRPATEGERASAHENVGRVLAKMGPRVAAIERLRTGVR